MSDIILPESIRRERRIYAILKDGPMKGFDNVWLEYDDELFPAMVVVADNALTREEQRVRESKLRTLQTLHRFVDKTKRDMVRDIEKKALGRPKRQYEYRLLEIVTEEEDGRTIRRPVYAYRGEFHPPRRAVLKSQPVTLAE